MSKQVAYITREVIHIDRNCVEEKYFPELKYEIVLVNSETGKKVTDEQALEFHGAIVEFIRNFRFKEGD